MRILLARRVGEGRRTPRWKRGMGLEPGRWRERGAPRRPDGVDEIRWDRGFQRGADAMKGEHGSRIENRRALA